MKHKTRVFSSTNLSKKKSVFLPKVNVARYHWSRRFQLRQNHVFSSGHLNVLLHVSALFLAPHLCERQRRLELHRFQKGLHHSSPRFPLQWARQICIHAVRSVVGHWRYYPHPTHLPASFRKGRMCSQVAECVWEKWRKRSGKQSVGVTWDEDESRFREKTRLPGNVSGGKNVLNNNNRQGRNTCSTLPLWCHCICATGDFGSLYNLSWHDQQQQGSESGSCR